MTVTNYINYFEQIVKEEISSAPYDQEIFLHYTKLNYQRHNRWMKLGVLSRDLRTILKTIDRKIELVIITEPWCGDAAHSLPFLLKMASENDSIHVTIQLRDNASEIAEYTTNGSRSIPKVIARDSNQRDLFNWGPRPKECQKLRDALIRADYPPDEVKIQLQQWYNTDKGKSLQREFASLFSKLK